MVCEKDPLHDGGLQFALRLLKLKVPCKIYRFMHMPHGLLNMSIPQGITQVGHELGKVYQVDPMKKILIIIDTCGESTNCKKVFGHDFSKFQQVTYNPNYIATDMDGYMAWTLRNVLQRSSTSTDTPFWLEPKGAGLEICLSVHLKKAQKLFGKKVQSPSKTNFITIENITAEINAAADRYALLLSSSKDVDKELENLMKKL